MKYKSVVIWNSEEVSLGNINEAGNSVSEDFHESFESAQAVCRGIKREGLGGQREIFPLEAYVEILDGDEVMIASSDHSLSGGLTVGSEEILINYDRGLEEAKKLDKLYWEAMSPAKPEPYISQTEFKRRVPVENLMRMSRKQKRLAKRKF